MKVKIHVSTAGVAGDPDKLLVGETPDGQRHHEMLNSEGWFSVWSFRRARKRMFRKIELMYGVRPVAAR